jgi:hypothetical protein
MVRRDRTDGNGNPLPERRRMARRTDDPEDVAPEVVLGYEAWVRAIVVHRGRIVAAVSAMAGALGFMAALFGFRVVGGPQDIAALKSEVHAGDSIASLRLSKLEADGAATRERVRTLEDADTFKMYLLCVLVRRVAPDALPTGCDIPKPQAKPAGIP